MRLRRLIAPLMFGLAIGAGAAQAQETLPPPLPGQGQVGTASDPAFPPVNGSSPGATVGAPRANSFPSGDVVTLGFGFRTDATIGAGVSSPCMSEFMPLREEAEQRGKLIKAASDRHAGPEEACALIKNFAQAEANMISYVATHAAECRIPDQISDQLKNGHKKTEALQTKVCALALERMLKYGPAGPTGDFDQPAVVR